MHVPPWQQPLGHEKKSHVGAPPSPGFGPASAFRVEGGPRPGCPAVPPDPLLVDPSTAEPGFEIIASGALPVIPIPAVDPDELLALGVAAEGAEFAEPPELPPFAELTELPELEALPGFADPAFEVIMAISPSPWEASAALSDGVGKSAAGLAPPLSSGP